MRAVLTAVCSGLLAATVTVAVCVKALAPTNTHTETEVEKVMWYDPPPGPADLSVALGELPDVLIADRLPNPPAPAARPDCYRGSYRFNADWFTHNVPVWEKSLASYKGKPGVRYLEVGIFEGRSAVWMLENILTGPDATFTGIDVFDDNLRDRWLANLKATGQEARATTIIGPSQIELRRFAPESFDIVYIDGDHSHGGVLEDNILAWRLVRPGGLLINDDYRMSYGLSAKERPKQAVDLFMRFIGADHFDVIHNDYQLILRRR